MKLYAVRIFVDDIAAARAFYGGPLGLGETWSFGDAAGYDLGGAELIVERSGDGALVGRFAGVSIQVDDIQHTYAELSAEGVEFDGPPEAQPWGGVLAHFKDPAGNTLTLLGSGS